jgi:hypothetical protein
VTTTSVDELEATLSKADVSKGGGGELFPGLGSSDPTAPLMELTARFQRVPPGYRLPTVGVEILHAEGMARKSSMYNILLPGARFLTAQSQLALRAHAPAHDAPCTCCPTRCIPSAARRCSTSCCSACTACDASCPYPRAGDPSWGSSHALHNQMHSGFEATAVTDENTIRDLLG